MHKNVIPGPASGTLQHAFDQRTGGRTGIEPEDNLSGVRNPAGHLIPVALGIFLFNKPGIAEVTNKPGAV